MVNISFMLDQVTFIQIGFVTNVTLIRLILLMHSTYVGGQVVFQLESFQTLVTLVDGTGVMSILKMSLQCIIGSKPFVTLRTLELLFAFPVNVGQVNNELVLATKRFGTYVTKEIKFFIMDPLFMGTQLGFDGGDPTTDVTPVHEFSMFEDQMEFE